MPEARHPAAPQPRAHGSTVLPQKHDRFQPPGLQPAGCQRLQRATGLEPRMVAFCLFSSFFLPRLFPLPPLGQGGVKAFCRIKFFYLN